MRKSKNLSAQNISHLILGSLLVSTLGFSGCAKAQEPNFEGDFESYTSQAKLESTWKLPDKVNWSEKAWSGLQLKTDGQFNRVPNNGGHYVTLPTAEGPQKGSVLLFPEAVKGTISLWFYDAQEKNDPFEILFMPGAGLSSVEDVGFGYVPWEAKEKYITYRPHGPFAAQPNIGRTAGWHQLRAEANGQTFKLFIDDQQVLDSAADGLFGFPNGVLGVFIGSRWQKDENGKGYSHTDYAFDGLQVTPATEKVASAPTEYGAKIEGAAGLWWAPAGYKITQGQGAPEKAATKAELAAAANEYEAFQIVANPERDVKNLRLTLDGFTGPNQARIDAKNIYIHDVEYVDVLFPSAKGGATGLWPDPLPLHKAPLNLKAGKNQPFWINVYIPDKTPPGVYNGELKLTGDGWERTVPVGLRVYDFALPHETHLRSAFNISTDFINRYHNLSTPEETRQVLAKYLDDFSRHRTAPFYYTNITPKVDFGVGATPEQVKIDWTAFDREMQAAFARYPISAWMLPLQNMGWNANLTGTVPLPYKAGTPQYETLMGSYLSQVQAHLKAKGWLSTAYVFWLDEPTPATYGEVRESMNLVKKYAPELTRLLTEQPEKELYGTANIWSFTPNHLKTAEMRERQYAGDEMWAYMASESDAPFTTPYVDAPATAMRAFVWQCWKQDVRGILGWQATYWTSKTAYPNYPNELQNPWTDSMCWFEGGADFTGQKIPWGNGDGRFLYPPNRQPGVDKSKYLDGPIDSIRWEMQREGIEDYEYFYLLREKVKAAEARPNLTAGQRKNIAAAKSLLSIPDTIVGDYKSYSTDLQVILDYRARVASAIESLG